jgi:hypothetical protein
MAGISPINGDSRHEKWPLIHDVRRGRSVDQRMFRRGGKGRGAEKDHIMVENKTGVDLKIRLTTRMKTDFPLPYGGSTKIEFPITTAKTLQVKAKSMDPNWNDCLISMRVGQTLIVHQAGEFIECKAE